MASLVRARILDRSVRTGRAAGPARWSEITLTTLALLVALNAGCGRKGGDKLFVVGFDGATWDLLEPWIEHGDLPNLKAFRDGAAWGTMTSVIPYLSPPAWTSAVTGVNPGRHGIFDFQRRLPGQNVIVTETAKSRRSPPIWNMLKGTGKRVAIVNIPMTDPPDEVDGVMVGGFPHLDTVGYAYPQALEDRCNKMGYILDSMEMKIPDGEEQQIFDHICASRDKCWELVKQLYSENDYDLFWVVFTGTDRVQHLFWKFSDPESPQYDQAKAAQFGDCMHRYWIDQDRILGQLLAMIRPGTWVLVLSDHGFGPMRRELRVGDWLHAPASRFAPNEAGDIFSLDRTDAARLYIREPGRDPGGTRNDADRAALRARLSAALAAEVDPETGKKPVEAIYPSEEVFKGKQAEKGPNLTVLPTYSYYIAWGDADTGYKLPAYGPVTSTLSGWHRMNGLYMLRGPGSRTGHLDRPFNLVDVAPTCLYLLGLPIYTDFDGKLMEGAIQSVYLKKRPLQMKGVLPEENRVLTPEEKSSLKNIPYVGG